LYNSEKIKNTILCGNVLDELAKLPDKSINMIVTSPPYFGLRNYGNFHSVWGGDKNCNHVFEYATKKGISGGTKSLKVQIKDRDNFQIVKDSQYGFCSICRAWSGELGQEPTHLLFIEHLMMIFSESKRILTDDGTLWVNLGDSYSANRGYQVTGTKQVEGSQPNKKQPQAKDMGLKSKSLMGIPDRFKIAMIDDGWIARNDIIWYKRNAMPDSTKDRFTVDYERIFFFTKNGRYYFDQQKEDCVNGDPNSPRGSKGTKTPNSGRRKQDDLGKANYTGFNDRYFSKPALIKRNIRSVWDIPVQPFRGAHFATFPPRLIETPIKAGCPENGIVLDIFFGAGTTGLVAKKLNRNYLGIEINPEYIEIAKERISKYT
jgi:DNA modification methylase